MVARQVPVDEILIEPDLDDLIPPLSTTEFIGLRQSIEYEGLRDALVVWPRGGGIVLLDGHNRHAIARELGIEQVPVVEREFASQDDVKLWMLQNQLGRRNLSTWHKASLVYRLRDSVAAEAEARRLAGLRNVGDPVVGRNSAQRGRTDEVLAALAGMHRDTFRRASRLQEQALPDILARLDSGELSVHAAYTELRRGLRRSDREEQAEQRRQRARDMETVEGFRYGNCLRYLPRLRRMSVRALISDVPYGVRARLVSRPEHFIKADDTVGDATQLLREILRAIDRALMDDAHLLIFTSPRFEPDFRFTLDQAGFEYRGSLLWIKVDSFGKPMGGQGDTEHAFAPSHERILHYTRGNPRLSPRLPDSFLVRPTHETTHLTEKPQELMRKLVECTTERGERVVDPCAGTGATLLAAKQLGRQFYGCEIRRVWYEEGVARLMEAPAPEQTDAQREASV